MKEITTDMKRRRLDMLSSTVRHTIRTHGHKKRTELLSLSLRPDDGRSPHRRPPEAMGKLRDWRVAASGAKLRDGLGGGGPGHLRMEGRSMVPASLA